MPAGLLTLSVTSCPTDGLVESALNMGVRGEGVGVGVEVEPGRGVCVAVCVGVGVTVAPLQTTLTMLEGLKALPGQPMARAEA